MKTRAPTHILSQHIDEADYLAIDVETTGLSPESGDRVCEIGAVKLRGGAVVETFGSLIDPQRPISYGAYTVNGITPQMLLDAPIFSSIAGKLWEMMQDSILVAYNAPFDLSFIKNEFRLIGYPAINNIILDALAIARQVLPGLGKYPQENVARFVGIPFPIKHRAMEDTMVTAQLFSIFTSILKAHDCTTVADLQRRDLTHVLHYKRKAIVDSALAERQNLWIKYLSPTNAEITDRIITPKDCFSDQIGKNRTTYLVAHCHTAKAERNFRLDRILDLRVV
ncbi:MAG: exonuclease domain-containing protein [Bacteroidota bacterium]|nr:exonuclease domain-containing protein [Bacteroidota bacterium]